MQVQLPLRGPQGQGFNKNLEAKSSALVIRPPVEAERIKETTKELFQIRVLLGTKKLHACIPMSVSMT